MPLYEMNGRKPEIGEGTWIAPSAEIIGDVRIGRNCYIGFGAIIRGDYGTITIGDESAIEEAVVIHARPMQRADIGYRVTVGHMALIHNATIRDWAVIGMHAVVTDYSEVGEWAIIAEHSLVKRKQVIPAGQIYGGSPAAFIGQVEERHRQEWTLGKQVYVDLTGQYRSWFIRLD
jgi:carbonic anhydrase/acetyltransferase-like protein (isoleucine patch superfamily)